MWSDQLHINKIHQLKLADLQVKVHSTENHQTNTRCRQDRDVCFSPVLYNSPIGRQISLTFYAYCHPKITHSHTHSDEAQLKAQGSGRAVQS